MPEQASNWERSIPRDQSWGGCRACRYLRPGMRCVAYPDGIPLIIADGQVDHLVVRPGQVGDTTFEVSPRPDHLARLRIQHGLRHHEAWALEALEQIDPVVAQELRDTVGEPALGSPGQRLP